MAFLKSDGRPHSSLGRLSPAELAEVGADWGAGQARHECGLRLRAKAGFQLQPVEGVRAQPPPGRTARAPRSPPFQEFGPAPDQTARRRPRLRRGVAFARGLRRPVDCPEVRPAGRVRSHAAGVAASNSPLPEVSDAGFAVRENGLPSGIRIGLRWRPIGWLVADPTHLATQHLELVA